MSDRGCKAGRISGDEAIGLPTFLRMRIEKKTKKTTKNNYRLAQDTVDVPSLNCFRRRLNKIRSTRMDFFMD